MRDHLCQALHFTRWSEYDKTRSQCERQLHRKLDQVRLWELVSILVIVPSQPFQFDWHHGSDCPVVTRPRPRTVLICKLADADRGTEPHCVTTQRSAAPPYGTNSQEPSLGVRHEMTQTTCSICCTARIGRDAVRSRLAFTHDTVRRSRVIALHTAHLIHTTSRQSTRSQHSPHVSRRLHCRLGTLSLSCYGPRLAFVLSCRSSHSFSGSSRALFTSQPLRSLSHCADCTGCVTFVALGTIIN